MERALARSREQRIGYLRGSYGEDQPGTLFVSKIGRDFRLSDGSKTHLCHPSVRDIDGVKREAMLVFHLNEAVFEGSG